MRWMMTWPALLMRPYRTLLVERDLELLLKRHHDLHLRCVKSRVGGVNCQVARVGRYKYRSVHYPRLKLLAGSGIEYMVSDSARPIRTVRFENPTDRIAESLPAYNPWVNRPVAPTLS